MTDNSNNNINPLSDLFNNKSDNKTPSILVSQDSIENIEEVKNNDFKYARDNLINTLEIGQLALLNLSGLAENTGHPRTYEVLTNLIKTLVDTSVSLTQLHKNNIEINKADFNNGPSTINNTLIVESTSKLSEIIEKKMKEITNKNE